MSQKQQVYDLLNALGISFSVVEHPAAFTVEDIQRVEFPPGVRIAKNLFLRDVKGTRHFLVVADAEQAINLRALEEPLHSTKLSFGSEERLMKHLELVKGSVSPFGVMNDPDEEVELYLDENLRDAAAVGLHPNDNTATVLLSFADLVRFLESTGHPPRLLRFA